MAGHLALGCPVFDMGHISLLDDHDFTVTCHKQIEDKLKALLKNSEFTDLVKTIAEMVKRKTQGFSIKWFQEQLKFLEGIVMKLWESKWIRIGVFVLLLTVLIGLCLYYFGPALFRWLSPAAGLLFGLLKGYLPSLSALPVLGDRILHTLANMQIDCVSSGQELHIGSNGVSVDRPFESSELSLAYPSPRHGYAVRQGQEDLSVDNDAEIARFLQEEEERIMNRRKRRRDDAKSDMKRETTSIKSQCEDTTIDHMKSGNISTNPDFGISEALGCMSLNATIPESESETVQSEEENSTENDEAIALLLQKEEWEKQERSNRPQ